MKTLKQSCIPRKSVFDASRRDTVLDLSDLIAENIDPHKFFEENYITDGMRRLLLGSFRRFEKKSDQGIFLLTQSMGGGKTHNMISLGLLANYPEFRRKVMGDDYKSKVEKVRVVGFTGRDTDEPYGIWGAIAKQLDKKEIFKDYYAPLSAPGPSAWINLLKGEPLLILLDELPPYFEHAKAKTIGDANLSTVTTTALSNLLIAVNKADLENVCVVISDLKATYEEGSQQVLRALSNLENEVQRSAIRLEPVGINTDEVYHILRTRLFEDLPDSNVVLEVAKAYAQSVKDAKQMDLTNASPEQFVKQIAESYPFHFSLRDLYARFRENAGFQQTRGLIRLMRIVVSRMYESGMAESRFLIHPYDLDLNHRETLAEITNINSSLENAIAHDIASEGGAIAESMDTTLKGTDAQDVAKLLLVSSLANVPNAVLGLTLSEVVSSLSAPGRDVSMLNQNIFGKYFSTAWYLHTSRDGKLFFKNVKNLVADLKTRAESYNRESSLKELRTYLKQIFKPSIRDCYQEVLPLPPIDEIEIKQDRITLVICQPHDTGGLSPDLQKFYEDLDYKNRILFLPGQQSLLENLIARSAEFKAINSIITELDEEKVPENDPQRAKAVDLLDQYKLQLLSACRETFTTLTFPHMDQLRTEDFLMNFTDNEYNGEKQIRDTLKRKQKFTEDVESDSFRKKCEQRLFTQKVMPWSEIKKRSGINTKWPWHHPEALDNLKRKLVYEDQWREDGGYVEKPPFPKPQTGVLIQELNRNDDTGEVTLRITPVHGDTLYYEIKGPATTGSLKVEDAKSFRTAELEVSFLCIDSLAEHDTGDSVTWKNRITIKSRIYQDGEQRRVELKSAPEAPIRYSTDGSNPANSGGTYDEPFSIPEGTQVVLAIAEKNGIFSDTHRLDIPTIGEQFEIDPDKPAKWHREHIQSSTKETYDFLKLLIKHKAGAFGPRVTMGGDNWVELAFDPRMTVTGEKLEGAVEHIRGLLLEGQVSIQTSILDFVKGQHLLDWVAEVRTEIKPEEVEQ